MSDNSIETQPENASFHVNLVTTGAVSFFSNLACHLLLVRIFGVYTDVCSGIESSKPANNALGYSIIAAFQVPALVFWLTREKSRLAIPIAIAANVVIGLFWVWWTTPHC